MSTRVWTAFEQARWFGGKGRDGRCVAVTPLDWYGPAPGEGPVSVRTEIASIEYPDGSLEHYQLLISYRREALPAALLPESARPDLSPDPTADPTTGPAADVAAGVDIGLPHDAMADPEALRLYLDAIGAHHETDTWSSMVVQPDQLGGAVTVFGGEQSNTSLMVGGRAMVKVFRKLEAGTNLDIAVHDALGRAGVHVAAKLFGWVEALVPRDGAPALRTDLAMAVEQLHDAKDGWDLATRSARSDSDFDPQAAKLGRALAQVHQALADTFAASRVDGADVAGVMDRRLAQALTIAPMLEPHAEALRRLFDGLRGVPLNVQRTHGDFHLGQTLSTPGGWRIIDFEGEPMKSLKERELPDSKWRDVAGMVRSFSYASSAADDPGSPEALAWVQRTTDAFVGAYCPTITPTQRTVLDAYIADKAIYEVVYEVRNRPTWVDIPMRAIRALTERN